MKNALFTIFMMAMASQAQASLFCSSDGSFGGIQDTRVTNPTNENPSMKIETTVVRPDKSTYVIQSQSQGTGSLETEGVVLFQNMEMGHGTTRYLLQKSGTEYQLVKSFQCDSARGEEFCNAWDYSFHVQNVFAGVTCSEY